MIKVNRIGQVWVEPVGVEVAVRGERVAVVVAGEARVYDLSGLAEGQVLLEPEGHLLAARRRDGGLEIDVLTPVTRGREFESEMVEDEEVLPEGAESALRIGWPEGPVVSGEMRLLRELVRALGDAGVELGEGFAFGEQMIEG